MTAALTCPNGHSLTIQHAGEGLWAVGLEHPACDFCWLAFGRLRKLCDENPDAVVIETLAATGLMVE